MTYDAAPGGTPRPPAAPGPPDRRVPTGLVAAVAVVAALIAVVLVLLLVVDRSTTGTRAAAVHPAPTAGRPPAATGTSPTTATSGPATTAHRPGSSSTTGSAIPTPAEDLTATPAIKAALAQALVADTSGLSPSSVNGTVPGTVYYARDDTTGTEYAVAAIEESVSDQAEAQAENAPLASPLQFGAENPFAFIKPAGGAWREQGGAFGAMGPPCPSFPVAILDVWGQTPGACHFPSGNS